MAIVTNMNLHVLFIPLSVTTLFLDSNDSVCPS
jgi:hypothetical protein